MSWTLWFCCSFLFIVFNVVETINVLHFNWYCELLLTVEQQMAPGPLLRRLALMVRDITYRSMLLHGRGTRSWTLSIWVRAVYLLLLFNYITHTHTHTRLTDLCPGLPRWAGTREVKPIWILLKQIDGEWHWHQLGYMQLCTSLQTDNNASTPPLSFLQAGCPSCRPTNSIKALKA